MSAVHTQRFTKATTLLLTNNWQWQGTSSSALLRNCPVLPHHLPLPFCPAHVIQNKLNNYFLHLFWVLFFCSYCGGIKCAIVNAEVNRCSQKRSAGADKKKGRPTKCKAMVSLQAQQSPYLLNRWLLTLILVLALKSSGSSMTGTGTWLRSLIYTWSRGQMLEWDVAGWVMAGCLEKRSTRGCGVWWGLGGGTYRVVDPPHQDAQNGITGSQDLHLLLHKMFLLGLSLGRQLAERSGSGARRRGHGFTPTHWLCVNEVSAFPLVASCLCKAALKSAFVVGPALTPPALDTSERRLSHY